MDIEGALEKPIGPLPLWGWLAGGIVLVGAFLVLRRGSSGGGGVGGEATYTPAGSIGAGAPDPGDTQPTLTPGDVAGSIDSAIEGLIDYGNAHWLGSGAAGGSGASQSPVPSPAQPAILTNAAKPYNQGNITMLPDWAQDAASWFFRSDTATGLASAPGNPNFWQDAPEDARAQLRQLVDQGWVLREPTYAGAKPY